MENKTQENKGLGICLFALGFGGWLLGGFGGKEVFEIVKFVYSMVGVIGLFMAGIYLIYE